MDKHILDSSFSLTEARVLFELGNSQGCTATSLKELLGLDKGYMSRILKDFEAKGLTCKQRSLEDGRASLLFLTKKGKLVLSELEEKSNNQVKKLIHHLSEEHLLKLVSALKTIEKLTTPNAITEIYSFRPEDVEHIIKRHGIIYKDEYGFDETFEEYVSKYIREFLKSYQENAENILVAKHHGKIIGSIGIVKVDQETAQLRWFYLEPEVRGLGLGKKLMEVALDFCREKNYKSVFLWTVDKLKPARKLYEKYGFKLTETKKNRIWGQELVEECWNFRM